MKCGGKEIDALLKKMKKGFPNPNSINFFPQIHIAFRISLGFLHFLQLNVCIKPFKYMCNKKLAAQFLRYFAIMSVVDLPYLIDFKYNHE